jgi:hypothetical protein
VNTSSSRLRIATRIHFALLRHYGAKVEIGALMKGGGDAREAMWVCEASGNAELASLAKQLKLAQRAERVPARAVAATTPAPQDAAWARDSSGFGLSRPLELEEPRGAGGASWLNPTSWMRRGTTPRHS